MSATQEEQSKADFVPENLPTMSNEEKQNWKKNKATISTFPIRSLFNRLFERLFYQEEQKQTNTEDPLATLEKTFDIVQENLKVHIKEAAKMKKEVNELRETMKEDTKKLQSTLMDSSDSGLVFVAIFISAVSISLSLWSILIHHNKLGQNSKKEVLVSHF